MSSLPLTDRSVDAVADAKLRRVARKFRALMDELDLDLGDPHLEGTELRVARAYRELFRGLAAGAEPALRTFPNLERYSEMVSVVDIPFYSLCAHHFLPFFGSAHVAYLPGDRIVGLSKLARVVEFYARRPQVQERMTEQLADLLMEELDARGVGVVLEATHTCMTIRGVRKPNSVCTTSAMRGTFRDKQSTRNELMALIYGGAR